MSDTFVEEVDATPDKKILQSIASDIDLKKGILELVDNSIDEWKLREKVNLQITITFDINDKVLHYSDNAGGIKEKNLNMIIQPGGTTRSPAQTSIGEFGVGLKRAIVALSKKAEVTSRFENDQTFKIVVDDSWITSPSWMIPKYKTTDITPASTSITFREVKFNIDLLMLQEIKQLLAEVYCFQLSDKFEIKINGESVVPVIFKKWAFPPHGRHPRTYKTLIRANDRIIKVDVTVGLMLTSSQRGEYGFDIYCNDRLIIKNDRSKEIGFVPGIFGNPHPTVAWFKAIVRINGANSDMPWNSTKSGLDYSNPIATALKGILQKIAKPYVQLSKRLYNVSQQQIANYKTGKIETVDLVWYNQAISPSADDFPDLPPGKRSQAELLLSQNKKIIRKAPWTRGLIENVYVVDLIRKKVKLENKNRFALLLLDTCLEVAFKDYLFRVINEKFTREQKNQFSHRDNLISAVKKNSSLPNETWKSIEFFYEIRCSLYHETASQEVTESDIGNFRDLVSEVLKELHGLEV